VVTIGQFAFFDVALPETLNLNKVETIGTLAFYGGALTFSQDKDAEEYVPVKTVVTVNAPNLKVLGDQAFTELSSLKNFNAPALEEIGVAAFAYTGIEKFLVGENLKRVESNVFEGCENFASFYTLVEGEENLNTTYENVLVADGVLYLITNEGYVLVAYPSAKADAEYTVIDGTVRIEYCAAYKNLNLETLILPASLKYIANHAFDGCEKLKTVKFNSYYAPTLEGTWSGKYDSITPENIEDFVGFDDLYKYNYYYKFENELMFAYMYHYINFKGMIGTADSADLTYVIPLNSYGYDSVIYSAYFNPSETENSGTVMGADVIAFIEAVKKLPDVVDRFNAKLIEDVITAYNKISGKASEMAYVDESVIAKFNEARSQYNVSVVENKLAHLFQMDKTEYCFNLVKDAKVAYDALTAEEKALVANASILNEKITELNTAWGKEVDLSGSYADNLPKEDVTPEPEPPIDDIDEGIDTWVIIVIAVAGAVVLGGAVVAVCIFVKKKKNQ
jgi:hypothetical protein